MESVEKVDRFTSVGRGFGIGHGFSNGFSLDNEIGNGNGGGYGEGNGTGYGNGKGYGVNNMDGIECGKGKGYGFNNGDGNGFGYCYGKSLNIYKFDGHSVYIIDGVLTCITSVHGNYAKGFTIKNNSTKIPCYVAKIGDFFAHGDTLEQARADAQAKYDRKKPAEERIADFVTKYLTLDTIANNRELFDAHNTLTGSCLFGRKQFVKRHGIDLDGSMSVREFIALTKDEYGGNTIKRLLEEYNVKTQ